MKGNSRTRRLWSNRCKKLNKVKMTKIIAFYGKNNFFFVILLLVYDLLYLISNYLIVLYYLKLEIFDKFITATHYFIFIGAFFFFISLLIIAILTIISTMRKIRFKKKKM